MAMSGLHDRYIFGPFELIPDRNVLMSDGVPVPLGSRAMQILCILVEHAGQVVSGQDLLHQVWPDTSVVESNLRVHLTNIRKHLVAATGETNAILTVPGQGYQFNLRVESHRTTSHQRSRSNLPHLWTELIGREAVIEDLLREIVAHRFITIVGSGGIGKTSVAIAGGQRASSMFEDGAVFVDFTTLSSQPMMINRIAGALRLPVSSTSLETSVLNCLKDRKTLLIFDNCEHVLEASAYLVEQILRACPEVHILTTSREPLQGETEHVIHLPALEYPSANRIPRTADEARRFPAIQLFLDRAVASQSWFVLRDEDAPALAHLCDRLGGIPLAIELAAARIDLFDLQALTQQLDRSLQLLTRGRRTAQERHKTLRATLDWSFGLLSDQERTLLSRLAVFQSAFDREGAAAVANDDVMREGWILDGVTSLAAKSLIVTSREGQTPIYKLLESTREYALEKLGSGPATRALRRRHAEYLRDLARKLAPQNGFVTPGGLDRYRRLVDEVRAAISWAFSPEGDPKLGTELAVASAYIWYQVSLLGEYTDIANRALEGMRGTPGSDKAELELLLAKAVGIFDTLGAVPELRASAIRALELARQLNDNVGIAWALSILWRYHHGSGEYENSLNVTAQLKVQADAGHDTTDLYSRLAMLSLLYLGRLEGAKQRALEASQFVKGKELSLRGAYDYDTNAFIKSSMARIYWLQGFPEQASAFADESVELALEARHSTGVCFALAMAGCAVKLWNSEFDAAERNIALLLDYSRAANSMYWQNYVEVFRSGLPSIIEATPARERRDLGYKAHWDARHWENFGVLRLGYATDQILERAKNDRCWWCAPEVLRLEAERVLTEVGPSGRPLAEDLFGQALSVAEEQGARQWKLRILTSMVRMWQNNGRRRSLIEQLDGTVTEFTEGFRFPDLRDAVALLERSGSHS
jgi:predicted ATPase/DNA-binding winged helix-turn-helix (wHTH) protein